VVPTKIEGDTWNHHKGWVEAKQSNEGSVAVRSMVWEFNHYALDMWFSSKISNGMFGMRNSLYKQAEGCSH
jgi:hypothetical protein